MSANIGKKNARKNINNRI